MTATTNLTGFIVRETEKAIAIVQAPVAGEKKPLWVPRSKVVSLIEMDGYSPSIRLAGEKVARLGVPVELEIDAAFAEKVGA